MVEEVHSFSHFEILVVCYKIVFRELYYFGRTYFVHPYQLIVSRQVVDSSKEVEVSPLLFVLECSVVTLNDVLISAGMMEVVVLLICS